MRRLLTTALALSAGLVLPVVPAAEASATEPPRTRLWLPTSQPHDMSALHGGGTDVRSGDVTGDGVADMVRLVDAAGGWRLSTTARNPGGSPDPRTTESARSLGSGGDAPADLALGDVDADGDLDAVVALSGGAHAYSLHRNDGTGGWTAEPLAPSGELGPRMRLADADGDGDLDMLRLDGAGTLRVAPGDGTGAFAAAAVVTTVPGARAFDTGDLTGDGRPDVAIGVGDDVVVVRNDGAGGVAGSDTYAAGPGADPFVADVTGDGTPDLVAGTTGAVVLLSGPDAPRVLVPSAASGLRLAGPDLVGVTPYGVFIAQRAGDGFAAAYSTLDGARRVAAADVTGDGLTDVLATGQTASRLWHGTPHGGTSVGIEPTVTLVNATTTASFAVSVLNATTPVPDVTWTAARGTFAGSTYTAPATAHVDGTPVDVVATLAETGASATRTIRVVNTHYSRLALPGREVRALAELSYPSTVYAGTDDGVYAATEYGQFVRVGAGVPDVRALAVGTGSGGATIVLALSGDRLVRFDGTTWREVASPAAVTSMSGGSGGFWAAAGGQVWHSADAATWRALGGAGVVEVDALDRDNAWAAAGNRLLRGRVDAAGSLSLTPVETPFPERAIDDLTNAGGGRPYVTFDGAGVHRYADTPYYYERQWEPLGQPGLDAVAPRSDLTAWRRGTSDLRARYWQDGTWRSIGRGFPAGVAVLTTGYGLVGTTDGVYSVGDHDGPRTPYVVADSGSYVNAAESSNFTIHGSDPADRYLCTLDGVTEPCPSPVSFPDLPDGSHVLEVRAVDAYGYESDPSAPLTWTVDRQAPPAPVITSAPDAESASATAAFTIQNGGPDPLYCMLDGAPVSCANGPTFTVADGTHTFVVWSADLAGNESPRVTHTWTVETGPAAPVLTAAPPRTTASTDATFAWEDSADAVRWTCAADGAEPVGCGDRTFTLSGLAEGGHTVVVRAYDSSDRSAATTHTWTVDLTAPANPVLTTVPPPLSASPTATLSWTRDPDAARYACAVDDTAPADCSTGTFTVYGLADGAHTATVHAYDAAGHSAATSHSWTVDTRPPALPSLTAEPPSRTNATSATFAWNDDADVARWTCSLDGAAAADCPTRTFTAEGLREGSHTFTIRAYDAAGNVASLGRLWTVDLTPPAAPALTAAPPAVTRSTSATFAWTWSSDVARWTCALDAAAPVSCSSGGHTVTGLAEGAHTMTVRAYDAAGNVSSTSRAWTVDVTPPPVPSLTAAPPARTAATTAQHAWDHAGDAVRYTCSLDGAAEADCSSRSHTATGLAEGGHRLEIRAYDEAGNYSSRGTSWVVDLTPPAPPVLTTAPPARTASTDAAFAWAADADVVRWTCTLDGTAATDCPARAYAVDGLAEGTHSLTIRAYDSVGNSSATTHDWAVELTAPEPPVLTTKPPALSASREAAFAWATAEDHSYTCTLDGAALACAAGSASAQALADGPHAFEVKACDFAARCASARHDWTVDATAPVVAIAAPPPVLDPEIVVTFNEPATATVRLFADGKVVATKAAVTPTKVTLTPVSPLMPGQTYTVEVTAATDAAGNVAVPATRTFRAPLRDQENGLAPVASWRSAASPSALGGSFHVSGKGGATATYAFSGTSVTWYAVRGPAYGLADVYVDGVLEASKVGFFDPVEGSASHAVSGLADGPHTLRIVVRGEAASPLGIGTDVAVDGFRAGSGPVDATPRVTWTWARATSPYGSGGGYAFEDAAGATYTITFRGRGIDWVSVVGPGMGQARVTIDGVHAGTFDNWDVEWRFWAVRSFTNLSDSVHTMTITVLGTRHPASTGTSVAVDRLDVHP